MTMIDTPVRNPPVSVRILYKRAGMSHIFYSPDLPGLHVGDIDLRKAFGLIVEAVSGLVEVKYNKQLDYSTDMSFEQFEQNLRPKAEVLKLTDVKPALTVSLDKAA